MTDGHGEKSDREFLDWVRSRARMPGHQFTRADLERLARITDDPHIRKLAEAVPAGGRPITWLDDWVRNWRNRAADHAAPLDAGFIEEEHRAAMNDIGTHLSEIFPGQCWLLVVHGEGRMNYIANTPRETTIQFLEELIAKWRRDAGPEVRHPDVN